MQRSCVVFENYKLKGVCFNRKAFCQPRTPTFIIPPLRTRTIIFTGLDLFSSYRSVTTTLHDENLIYDVNTEFWPLPNPLSISFRLFFSLIPHHVFFRLYYYHPSSFEDFVSEKYYSLLIVVLLKNRCVAHFRVFSNKALNNIRADSLFYERQDFRFQILPVFWTLGSNAHASITVCYYTCWVPRSICWWIWSIFLYPLRRFRDHFIIRWTSKKFKTKALENVLYKNHFSQKNWKVLILGIFHKI